MSTTDLLQEIRALLQAGTIAYTSESAVDDVYEGFIFAQVVATARSIPTASVHFADGNSEPTKDLVFRLSPGRLYSSNSTFTHAVIELGPGIPPLEAHIGVKVRGSTEVEHECDVLVLSSEEADRCRQNRTSPQAGKCLLAVECKYYTNPLELSLARGFTGLKSDLGNIRYALFAANRGSPNVKKFLSGRNLHHELTILPNTPSVPDLRWHIREAFKKHGSKHNPAIDL